MRRLWLALFVAGCGVDEAGVVLELAAAEPADFDRVELTIAASAALDGPLCAPALVVIEDPGCLPLAVAIVPGEHYGELLVARAVGLDAGGDEVARAEVAVRFADELALDARIELAPSCYAEAIGDGDSPSPCRNEAARSLLDAGAPEDAPPCVDGSSLLPPADCLGGS